MEGSKIAEYIEEHQPLDPAQPSTWGALIFAGVYLFVLAGTLPRKPHITWLLPIFWLLQMFMRVRHAPLFAMTGFVAIASMWPHTCWARMLLKRPDFYNPTKPVVKSMWGWLLPAFAVGLCFVLQIEGARVPVIGAGWAAPDPQVWPMDLIETLKAHEPKRGKPANTFTECHLGGFLSFQASGYKTFIDDRAELYEDEFIENYVNAVSENIDASMRLWQERYGQFQFAFVRPKTIYADYFNQMKSEWELVGISHGDAAAFYRRR
jgi:hypothetical protein